MKFVFKKRRRIVIGIVILLLIVVIVFAFNRRTPAYELETVKKSTITEVITETGVIEKKEMTQIYSSSTGIVQTVSVANGDRVKKGDALFAIQSTATKEEQARALASYLTAKNSLDAAQATLYSLQSTMFQTWDRYKTLAESDEYQYSDKRPRTDKREKPEFIIAQKNWLAAESAVKNQQSVIAQTQATTQAAYLDYQSTQNTTITALADGVVQNIAVAQGGSVVPSNSTNPSAPVAVILGNTKVEARVSLTENDIVKVKEGQPVVIKVKPLPEKEMKGTVSRLDAVGTSVQGVTRYSVYIDITEPEEALLSGMKANIQIITAEVTDVLSVSSGAIKPYKGGKAVRIVDQKDQIEFVPVKVGIRGGGKTQILEGVEEGQEIILSLSNEQLNRPSLLGN